MIRTKNDLKYYLECDRLSRKEETKRPKFFGDEIWKYQILLRKVEYFNNNRSLINKIFFLFYKYRFHNLGIKLGFSIPPNVFGPGLNILHYGTIVVNKDAKVGENCTLFHDVTIGTTRYANGCPNLGNNIMLGTGCKIIGGVVLADNIAVGVNAVVTKSFLESNISIAGIPAKKINNKGISGLVVKGTKLIGSTK